MRRWILIGLCIFLVVMPVHATELDGEMIENKAEAEGEIEEEEEEVIEEPALDDSEQEEEPKEGEPEDEEQHIPADNIPKEESVPEEPVLEVTPAPEPVPETTPVSETVPETEPVPMPETESAAIPENLAVTEEVNIPDVVGKTETEAKALLQQVILPDGSTIEIIVKYKYTKEAPKDIVYKQSLSGMVEAPKAQKISIFVSMGIDPAETIVDGYLEPLDQRINSKYGIDWDSQPEVYEYNWDNSQACWETGVWIDSVKYLTPEGTYNTNVRHKIQLYTDGTYVYTHIVYSRDYSSAANGSDFNYYVDGNRVSFQVETYNGKQLESHSLSPGTYEVRVRHASGSTSGTVASDASAFFTVFESQLNPHLEMRIPLSEMVLQNGNIDVESFGGIRFTTPNLMMGSITAAGADTAPFVMAVAAFIIIPATGVAINRKKKITIKESNVQ